MITTMNQSGTASLESTLSGTGHAEPAHLTALIDGNASWQKARAEIYLAQKSTLALDHGVVKGARVVGHRKRTGRVDRSAGGGGRQPR